MDPALVLAIAATHSWYPSEQAIRKHRTAPYQHFTKSIHGESKAKRLMKKASRRKNRK